MIFDDINYYFVYCKQQIKRQICVWTYIIILLQFGRTKETTAGNKIPVARAGEDIFFKLLGNTTKLDGSISLDPDGTIQSFLWTKISGPPIFRLLKTDSAKVMVKELVEGEYMFELSVTDNDGAIDKDTCQVWVMRDGESIQFNNIPPADSSCVLTITNINEQLPLVFNLEVYIRRWYTLSSSGIWEKINDIPDRAVNISLQANAYWYWYENKVDTLLIHYQGNVSCILDKAFHDVYIKF